MKKWKKSDKWALGILFSFIGLFVVAYLGGPGIGIGEVLRQKKSQTEKDLTALHHALNYFYGEYARLPSIGSEGETVLTEGPEGVKLLLIMIGKEEEGPGLQNPRQIAFLNVRRSRNKNKGGLFYNNGGTGALEGFYDAWGNPFHVYLRKLGSSSLSFSHLSQTVSLDQPAAVFSCGPDKIPGTKDDLKSW